MKYKVGDIVLINYEGACSVAQVIVIRPAYDGAHYNEIHIRTLFKTVDWVGHGFFNEGSYVDNHTKVVENEHLNMLKLLYAIDEI